LLAAILQTGSQETAQSGIVIDQEDSGHHITTTCGAEVPQL
jgi:hypothetical protein